MLFVSLLFSPILQVKFFAYIFNFGFFAKKLHCKILRVRCDEIQWRKKLGDGWGTENGRRCRDLMRLVTGWQVTSDMLYKRIRVKMTSAKLQFKLTILVTRLHVIWLQTCDHSVMCQSFLKVLVSLVLAMC